jgi:hypothetical protein
MAIQAIQARKRSAIGETTPANTLFAKNGTLNDTLIIGTKQQYALPLVAIYGLATRGRVVLCSLMEL